MHNKEKGQGSTTFVAYIGNNVNRFKVGYFIDSLPLVSLNEKIFNIQKYLRNHSHHYFVTRLIMNPFQKGS